MDQPKLKICDRYVGLRAIQDNVYEPKNIDILRKTIGGSPDKHVINVVTYFQNNDDSVKQKLEKIEANMTGHIWNLIVIDNGSVDDTYKKISKHRTAANNYLHLSINRIVDKKKFINVCLNYAKEYLVSDSDLLKIVHNTDAAFQGENASSFCFMATKEIATEAIILVYSIRCFHDLPIYIICDEETKASIEGYVDCFNVFFECSATQDTFDKIQEEHKTAFARSNNNLHQQDRIYHKMRAIDFALENEPNTLFLDSDIIIVDRIDDLMYSDLVMSPHFWGAHTEYGIYNAGYIFTSDKGFTQYWRDLYLNRSTFCEQEATNYFSESYDLDIFGPEHNHGFWRNEYHIDNYKSFHCHIFGLPEGRNDKTAASQDIHRNFVLDFLYDSQRGEHRAIREAIECIRDKKQGKLKLVNGKYSRDDWDTHKMVTPGKSNSIGKINLRAQTIFNSHRSGWKYAMENLIPLHNERGTLFDGFLENNFAWRAEVEHREGRLSRRVYDEPWIGFFHNPQNIPGWFFNQFSIENILSSDTFQQSLKACGGLFALSKHHADYINQLTGVPVSVLYHPTEFPHMLFDFNRYNANQTKKVINIGYWLRKMNSIYMLPVDRRFEKWRLMPYTTDRPKNAIDALLLKEREVYNIIPDEHFANTKTIDRLSNDEYDISLSENIVFLDLYESSANNAIIECIARTTPVVASPIPAVVEYLGEDYPLYFNTLDEAAEKINDDQLILDTHNYLKQWHVRDKLTGEYFRQSLQESEIYKSL